MSSSQVSSIFFIFKPPTSSALNDFKARSYFQGNKNPVGSNSKLLTHSYFRENNIPKQNKEKPIQKATVFNLLSLSRKISFRNWRLKKKKKEWQMLIFIQVKVCTQACFILAFHQDFYGRKHKQDLKHVNTCDIKIHQFQSFMTLNT